MLTKEQILGAMDTTVEQIDVPEWDGTVFVRTLSGTELDEFEGENYEVVNGQVNVNKRNVRARLLSRAICDQDGKPLFTLKDVEALGKKSGRALNRVVAVAERINGLDKRALEDAGKNLGSGLGEDSSSL